MSIEEIKSSDDAQETALNIDDDLESLITSIDSGEFEEALSKVRQIKDALTALEIFLIDKAKENG